MKEARRREFVAPESRLDRGSRCLHHSKEAGILPIKELLNLRLTVIPQHIWSLRVLVSRTAATPEPEVLADLCPQIRFVDLGVADAAGARDVRIGPDGPEVSFCRYFRRSADVCSRIELVKSHFATAAGRKRRAHAPRSAAENGSVKERGGTRARGRERVIVRRAKLPPASSPQVTMPLACENGRDDAHSAAARRRSAAAAIGRVKNPHDGKI